MDITKITHDDLIQIGVKWLKSQHSSGGDSYNKPNHFYHAGCGVILSEFVSMEQSIPDVIGFNNCCSVVIECKISHADFLADLKKPHRAIANSQQCGNYRYYLTLPNIIKPEEITNGWGLLYYDGKVHLIKNPEHKIDTQIKVAEYSILYSIARRATLKGLMPNILKNFNLCASCGKLLDTDIKTIKPMYCDDCSKPET
jgi:hypothetical protein